MLNWFQALMPREDRFFTLFNQHAATLALGAGSLSKLLSGGPNVADGAREVYAHEDQADVIARDVLQLVRRSFITPFDRSDIKDLISSLDDTIDQMRKTAKAVVMFEVERLEPEMAQMGEQIQKAAQLTVEAVSLLSSMRQNSARLQSITETIIHLEEDSDALNDAGIKALFKRHRNGNAMEYLIGLEIYDHLEKVMDRFEDVAKRISGIMIEQL